MGINIKEYPKIGSVKWIKGTPYFLFGNSENGMVFKDWEAYHKDWDAPCYVPEYAAEDAAVTVDGVEYECGGQRNVCDWYSHNDLLRICHYNRRICDAMFESLDWVYPETWLQEARDSIDYRYAFDFVKPGATVYWNDPEHDRCSGYWEVCEICDDGEEWDCDTMVRLGDGNTEVYLSELSRYCPTEKLHDQAVRDFCVIKSWFCSEPVRNYDELQQFLSVASSYGAKVDQQLMKDEDGGWHGYAWVDFGVARARVYVDTDKYQLSQAVDVLNLETGRVSIVNDYISNLELERYE
jgi:hypothetical protein